MYFKNNIPPKYYIFFTLKSCCSCSPCSPFVSAFQFTPKRLQVTAPALNLSYSPVHTTHQFTPKWLLLLLSICPCSSALQFTPKRLLPLLPICSCCPFDPCDPCSLCSSAHPAPQFKPIQPSYTTRWSLQKVKRKCHTIKFTCILQYICEDELY